MFRFLLVHLLIAGLMLCGCSSRQPTETNVAQQSSIPTSTEGKSAPSDDTPSPPPVRRADIPESRWRDMRRASAEGLLQTAKVAGGIVLIGGALVLIAAYAFAAGMK